jgi:3-mercaptopyruvate sulfurtransferase SseA
MTEIALLEGERNAWKEKSALAEKERDRYKEKYARSQNKVDALEQMQKAVDAAVMPRCKLATKGA